MFVTRRLMKCSTIHTFKRDLTIGTGGGVKVCILGAGGSLGRPLSVLLKQCSWFEEIALYDQYSMEGVAAQLNQLETRSKATAFGGLADLPEAIKGSHIVVLVAGSPRKCGVNKDEQAEENAAIIAPIVAKVAANAPTAFFAIVTDPLNVMVPFATEIYHRVNRTVDHNKIFGVTTMDVVRAENLVAAALNLPPKCVTVPVVGGQSVATTVPVLSKTEPAAELPLEERVRITRTVQSATDRMVSNKRTGGPTYSAAYAVAKFVQGLARALSGRKVVQCAYVKSLALSPTLDYVATPLKIGTAGIEVNLGIPELNDYEEIILETAMVPLAQDIELGKKLAKLATI